MIDQSLLHYQVERAAATAIIYIRGDTCSASQVRQIAAVTDALPTATRLLRLDLHGVLSMDLDALMDLRAVMARWRSARQGVVRLLLRSPLPRAAWPTNAIHFDAAPMQRSMMLPKHTRFDGIAPAYGRVGAISAGAL